MKLGRRGILGMFGGAAALPATKVLEAAGVSTDPLAEVAESDFDLTSNAVPSKNAVNYWADRRAKAFLLKTLNPGFLEYKRRAETRRIYALDPDLASFVSMSPVIKMAIQRERQYHRFFKQEEEYISMREQEEMFNAG